jgi:hypothetical protein
MTVWIYCIVIFIITFNFISITFLNKKEYEKKNVLHSLGLVYKSMRGMMTNSIDRDQWLNVTSESLIRKLIKSIGPAS